MSQGEAINMIFTKSSGQLEGKSAFEMHTDENSVLFLNGNLILKHESQGVSGINIRKLESAAHCAVWSTHPCLELSYRVDAAFHLSLVSETDQEWQC